MAEIKSPRRYYLLKSQEARKVGDEGLQRTWWAKQDKEAASLLPSSFPHLQLLQDARYFAQEDLDGADEAELREEAGLNAKQAKAVLKALAKLIG